MVRPGDRGLEVAAELGRRALVEELSMLELVGLHLRARRRALAVRGIEALDDVDAFLREALTAFEITQRAYLESRRAATAARQRAQLLTGLSRAYMQIATATTFPERVAQVCAQAQRFLDADEAVLEFGRPSAGPPGDDRDEMSAALEGSGGLLVLRARPGRTWSDDDRTTLSRLALLVSAPIDDARRLDFAQRLERLGAALNEALDHDAVLAALAEAGRTAVGAPAVSLWLAGSERLLGADGDERRRVLAAVADANGPYLAQRAPNDAWAVLPLDGARGRLGAVGLWYDEGQPFDGVQRDFLAQLADRVARSVERVQAYDGERMARRAAEVASERIRSLQLLATELARASTRRRVAQLLLRRAGEATGAAGGMVAAGDGRRFEVLAAVGALAPAEQPDAPPLTDAVLAAVDGTEGATLDELPPDLQHLLRAAGVGDVEVVPIRVGRRTVGLLCLCWTRRADREGLELLAAQVAVAGPALQRAERYDVEHDIAETLQRSILARPTLERPDVRWSVHYRAGSAGLAGGDWYDLYALDERRVAMAVGDIVGQGVQAAAAMGQLRSAARAISRVVDDPGALVATLDDYATTSAQGRFSTMAYLVLDTATGELRHTLAGHPPPVLRLPDGSTSLLEDGRGPLLGLARRRVTARRHVPPGSRLVLYTDGLVERRDESLDVGLDRLCTAIARDGGELDPDALCPALAAHLLPGDDQAVDDVAIMVVELLG